MNKTAQKQINRITQEIARCADPEENKVVDLSHLVPGMETELAEAQARLRNA